MASAGAAQQDKLAERGALSRLKGQQNAPVSVLEFADFECPYCARFVREVFPRIDSAYVQSGKVQWVFVNLPLPNHRHAWIAAEAAMCAGAVSGRFWPMHDRLFAEQAEWTAVAEPASLLKRYAQESGVAVAEFEACVANDRMAAILVRDVLYGGGMKVSGTPAFVINNQETFVGMKTFEEWQQILDAALRKAQVK